jgi:hypothetical protein
METTATDLTAGTVITFTGDITGVTPCWAELTVDTHLIVTGATLTGNHVRVLNTRTGRHDYVPTYSAWVFRLLRIIHTPDPA